MRIPQGLMKHSIDHYAATFTKESGARVSSYPTHPTTEDIPCNVQEALSELVTEYLQRNERVKLSVFLVLKTAYDAISIRDRLVFQGDNFRVVGKQNLCNLHRVYRIDLQEEV